MYCRLNSPKVNVIVASDGPIVHYIDLLSCLTISWYLAGVVPEWISISVLISGIDSSQFWYHLVDDITLKRFTSCTSTTTTRPNKHIFQIQKEDPLMNDNIVKLQKNHFHRINNVLTMIDPSSCHTYFVNPIKPRKTFVDYLITTSLVNKVLAT